MGRDMHSCCRYIPAGLILMFDSKRSRPSAEVTGGLHVRARLVLQCT